MTHIIGCPLVLQIAIGVSESQGLKRMSRKLPNLSFVDQRDFIEFRNTVE